MPDQHPQQPFQVPLELPAFGAIERDRVIAEDELFAVVQDTFPVASGHTLIIPKRPLTQFKELTAEERSRLMTWVDWVQRHLQATLTAPPEGFTLGINDGPELGS